MRPSKIALDSIISAGLIKYEYMSNNLLVMKKYYTSISQNLDYADSHVLVGSNVAKLTGDAMFYMELFQNDLSLVNLQLTQYKQGLEKQRPIYCFR